MQTDKYPTVIYIMGYGYSGSTFLDTLLGNFHSVESVGELNNFYRYAWRRGKQCACGKKLYECKFWSAVDRQWRKLADENNSDRLIRAQDLYEYYLNPFLWLKLLKFNIIEPDQSFQLYARLISALYGAISKIGKKKVVVDSSKSPARAAALLTAGFNLKTIHLLRDSRGVVWSKLKRLRKAKSNKTIELFSVVRTAIGWTITNFQSILVNLLFTRNSCSFIKYEDLVLDPLNILGNLKTIDPVDFDQIKTILANDQPLHIGHIVSGNKMRKQTYIKIKPDFDWKEKLPLHYKILTTLLTFPLLLTYRYKIRPTAIDDR